MEKTFTYEFETKQFYLENSDESDYETEKFDYTADESDLLEAVVDFTYEDYFIKTDLADRVDYAVAVKSGLKRFISDNDNLEELVRYYDLELEAYFRGCAYEEYINERGVKQ